MNGRGAFGNPLVGHTSPVHVPPGVLSIRPIASVLPTSHPHAHSLRCVPPLMPPTSIFLGLGTGKCPG